MWNSLITTPRPVPGKLVPAAGAALVLGLSLLVFLIAGWSVAAWGIGAVLWAGIFCLGLLLGHLRSSVGNLASSGVLGLELMLKAIIVLVVLVAIAASRPGLAVGAILVFALAYTVERALSLASYFGAGQAR
jgi:hypothetical protein